MKLKRPGLLTQIIIAIVLGIGAGIISPALPVRIFVTFNGLFSEFLAFIIPLIIVGLVAPAIADIGKGAGKMLAVTALLAYGATLFSGFTSYAVGCWLTGPHFSPGLLHTLWARLSSLC